MVDFEGKQINLLTTEDALAPYISISDDYQLSDCRVERNAPTGGWRLIFQIGPQQKENPLVEMLPGQKRLIELRAALKKDEQVFTETWSYAIDI